MASITVRQAVEDDLPAIFDLGRLMRAESEIPFPDIDEEAAREMLGLLGEAYFIAVAEIPSTGGSERQRQSALVGMLTAQLSRYIFVEEFIALHDIFYVHPDWRGSMAAFLLVGEFEKWGRERGLARAVLGIHTGLFPERTGRFYQRLGYRPMGGNFMKELD